MPKKINNMEMRLLVTGGLRGSFININISGTMNMIMCHKMSLGESGSADRFRYGCSS